MGRPRKPTRLKLLEGNPGKRPINENEPRPRQRQRIPSPPDSLDDVGQKEWRRLGPELARLGLLTNLDVTAFHIYCDTFERWVKASRESKNAPLIQTPGGVIRPNPYTALANRLFYMLNQSLARFGMDPASRSRIAVDPADRDDDELSRWLYSGTGA